MKYALGFLGAGNMAEAIARAAIDQRVLSPSQIMVADPQESRRQVFNSLGVASTDRNDQLIRQSQHILIAVKPQMIQQVAVELAQLLQEDQVIISIMAGVTTAGLENALNKPARIVRVMPNTPLFVGCGMTAVTPGPHARRGDEDLTMQLFAAGGQVIRVDESKLDAITAVSGSGPAYVFYLAQAMQAAAAELGLGDHADLLVRQTVLGAAQLLAESDDSPSDLRRRVTSPGGTTEAAINQLQKGKFLQAMADAIKAACQRSEELGS